MKNTVLYGPASERLREIPPESVQTCVCSPPYWGLRDYEHSDQLGCEDTPEGFCMGLALIFEQVKKVLKPDGTLWLNLGDSYVRPLGKGQHKPGDPGKQDYIYSRGGGKAATEVDMSKCKGLKPKDLVGIPWRAALTLQKFGWYLRSDIVWNKPNAKPEPVEDRPVHSHEYVFLFSKSETYYFDPKALREPASKGFRNGRSVWDIKTEIYKGAHFAVMPTSLAAKCIEAGSRKGDLILDPFAGSGTTFAVATDLGRDYLGIELNEEKYRGLIEERLAKASSSREDKDTFNMMMDLRG